MAKIKSNPKIVDYSIREYFEEILKGKDKTLLSPIFEYLKSIITGVSAEIEYDIRLGNN